MSTLKNASVTLTAQVILIPVGIINSVITARFLGLDGKGLFYAIMMNATLLSTLFSFGTAGINRNLAGRPETDRRALMGHNLSLLLIITVIALVISRLYRNIPIQFFQKYPPELWMLTFIGFPLLFMQMNFMGLFISLNRIHIYNGIRIFTALFQMLYNIVFLGLFHLGYATAAIGWCLSLLIVILFSFYRLRSYISLQGFDLKQSYAFFRFGFVICLSSIVNIISFQGTVYIVQYYLTPGDLGIYSIVKNISGFLYLVPTSVGVAALPNFAAQPIHEANRLLSKAVRTNAIVSFTAMVGLAFLAYFMVVPLYGQAFRPAVVPALIALPGVFLFGFAHITTPYYASAHKKPGVNTALSLLQAVLALCLGLLFVPRYGVVGAALTTTMTFTISIVVNFLVLRLYSGLGFVHFLPNSSDVSYLFNIFKSSMQKIRPGVR